MNKVVETKEKPSATAEKIAHTPGPWRTSGVTYPIGILSDWRHTNDPEVIAQIGGDTMSPEDSSENEANARLIAAAPETKQERDELLSIVRGFVGAWNDWTVERDVREWIETSLKPQIGYARAAIAKAEGK